MKQEWQDISTAPVGIYIFILDSMGKRTIGLKSGDNKFITHDFSDVIYDATLWHPFPDFPEEENGKVAE